MTPPSTEIDDPRGKEDEDWAYDVDEPIPIEEIENDSPSEAEGGLSSLVPFVEFDREEGTLNFSRRQR